MTFISRACRLAALAVIAAFLAFSWLPSGAGPAIAAPVAANFPAPLATAAHSAPAVLTASVHAAASYTVRSGDTLSRIARGHGKSLPAVEAANPQIGNPDLIFPGQRVSLSGGSAMTSAVVRSARGGSYGHPYRCGDGDGDGWDRPCSSPRTAPHAASHSPASHVTASHFSSASRVTGSSSFERCVISHESGGNSQVMNSSGHYGLYQFDLSTWESGGGSASSFGHASASAQQRVFHSVYALRGTQPWGPYDGC